MQKVKVSLFDGVDMFPHSPISKKQILPLHQARTYMGTYRPIHRIIEHRFEHSRIDDALSPIKINGFWIVREFESHTLRVFRQREAKERLPTFFDQSICSWTG